jgi:uncharacterized damage-inducible protein DinB
MAQPEVWLRGAVPGIAPEWQPIAHALLQVREDVERVADETSDELLWRSPGGAASVGFHLLHLAGSTDRLFTYARGNALSESQRAALAAERDPAGRFTAAELKQLVAQSVERSLDHLRATPPDTWHQSREVGRGRLPSTVMGLLFHAAEHATRHAGQAATTLKILRAWPHMDRASRTAG